MENILYAEQKMLIFQRLMFIDNKDLLAQIQLFIDTFLAELETPLVQEIPKKREPESIDNESETEFDATKLSFEAWNKQFTDNRNLDEYIPEHDMTLGEFRRSIYEAEADEEISREDFFESMKQW